MKRRHRMPFGAECRDDGSVRFRLWAPAARRVELLLARHDSAETVPMEPVDTGWFEVVTRVATAGGLYRFLVTDARGQAHDVPDPASRFQPQNVHGPSEVINPYSFDWQDDGWRGRPWEEAVIYEVHAGTFSQAGNFAAVEERLDYLADLGITAVELMPVSDFPGARNWGYDGVFCFAPDSTYGRPEDLKRLVQAAHARRMMVLLDVVYNHLGPEGNYLGVYAPQFFTDRHKTPWGNGINFDGPSSRTVRDFFIQNALYWLEEYHLDGLRLDAVHAILDDSTPDILTELSAAVWNNFGAERQVHLILENEGNQSSRLKRTGPCRPQAFTAQWNDDMHHALHVLVSGERDGYYSDYADRPLDQLGRCLVSGFAYQGDVSLYKNGEKRGEPTQGLPLTAFVSFMQNHDQIGNRAFGERLLTVADPRAIRAASAIFLLAPSPPLLFMGEEFGAQTPFLFFCDFEKDLAAAVTAGRRNEFARFTRFSDPESRRGIPDPNAPATFESSRLDWKEIGDTRHQTWLRLYRQLLRVRSEHIVPRLSAACQIRARYEVLENRGLSVRWEFPDGAVLALLANLSAEPLLKATAPESPVIYAIPEEKESSLETMAPWSVVWTLKS